MYLRLNYSRESNMQRPLKNSSFPRLKMHRGWVERRAFDDFHAAPWSGGIKNALVSRENASRRCWDWENHYTTVEMCAAPCLMLLDLMAPLAADVSVVDMLKEHLRDCLLTTSSV